MKRILTLAVLLLLTSFSAFAQDKIQYKEYSYTEFFKMIEDEEDSVFRLRNAIIRPNATTDQYFLLPPFLIGLSNDPFEYTEDYDSLIVDKAIVLANVQFINSTQNSRDGIAFLRHIHFKKKVTLNNVAGILVADCTFDQHVTFRFYDSINSLIEDMPSDFQAFYILKSSHFKNGLNYSKARLDRSKNLSIGFMLSYSLINEGNDLTFIENNKEDVFKIFKNEFKGESASIWSKGGDELQIEGNIFDVTTLALRTQSGETNNFSFKDNTITGYTHLEVKPNETTLMDWSQFQGKSITGDITSELVKFYSADSLKSEHASPSDRKYIDLYFDRSRNENAQAYKNEQRVKGRFIILYRLQNDMEYANMVYVESKDLETKRLAYLYKTDPHFNTFFSWKINQFLKVFSAYGTEPARAIVFSMYVIIAFALVYLFFPNHWDSHGKNRIVDRFSFFLKYMKRDAGMHDVYLEEKQGDILAYDEYKNLLESSGKDVPKFFQATGLPLYKWAISGTKLTASFLSRVDVMKGTWSELPASKRMWKSVLLISAFLIALTYDIFIKMLNALMLSINTFTTLGFGEIPIKGLPRYLAIIQGFIGWFMLTIFSVSLISQLLN